MLLFEYKYRSSIYYQGDYSCQVLLGLLFFCLSLYIFLSSFFFLTHSLYVSCIMPIRMKEGQQKQSTHYAHRSRFPSSLVFSYLSITHNNVEHACICLSTTIILVPFCQFSFRFTILMNCTYMHVYRLFERLDCMYVMGLKRMRILSDGKCNRSSRFLFALLRVKYSWQEKENDTTLSYFIWLTISQ